MEPDISKFNLEELQSALAGIDKGAYPDRHNHLKQAEKEKLKSLEKLNTQYQELTGKTVGQAVESSFTQNKLVEQLIYAVSSIGLIFALITLCAVLGANTIEWEGKYVHGFNAIVPGLLITMSVTLAFCLINLIGVFVSKLLFKGQTLTSNTASHEEK